MLPSYVCQFNKAIYDLEQLSCQCFTTLSSYLEQLGFQRSQDDHSLHILHKPMAIIYFLVYVDDILILGNHSKEILNIIQQLNQHFHMKDLGHLSTFLNIQVVPASTGFLLTQHLYAGTILQQAGMTNCHLMSTPNE